MTCPNDELVWKASNEKDPSYGYNVEMGQAWRPAPTAANPNPSLSGPGFERPVRKLSDFAKPSALILFGDSWHNDENPAAYGGDRSQSIRPTGIHFWYTTGFSYKYIFKGYTRTVINGTRHNGNSANIGHLDGHVVRAPLEEVKFLSADPSVVPAAGRAA